MRTAWNRGAPAQSKTSKHSILLAFLVWDIWVQHGSTIRLHMVFAYIRKYSPKHNLVLFGFMPYSCYGSRPESRGIWANRPCVKKCQFDNKPRLDFIDGPCAKNFITYLTSPGTVLKHYTHYMRSFAQLGCFNFSRWIFEAEGTLQSMPASFLH